MVIPYFRKAQVNGKFAVLGITKSVKKKLPHRESTKTVPMGQMTVIFKMMEAARMSAFGTKRTSGHV